MQIGEVIRKYRKTTGMTQDEMAKRLGVSAPAVNKWENGNSQPDIMLLAPIARLLHINLDTLLCFEQEPSLEEINRTVQEMDAKLKAEVYEDVFRWAKEKIEQYPNSEQLIWQLALVLDVWRITKEIPDSEQYDGYINDCYIRALGSEDEEIRTRAADSLFGFYTRKEEYEKAEEYLNYFSRQNPEKQRKQAFIYSKTNRIKDAYQAYEQLLFSGYQMANMVFQSMYILTMEENNREKARILMEKQSELARIFDMGKYNIEGSAKLDFVTAQQDVDATIEVMETMLTNVDTIFAFTESVLYEHMEFKEVDTEFIEELRQNIQTCFRDEEIYGYMKENKCWQDLIS